MIVFNTKQAVTSNNITMIYVDIPCNYTKTNNLYNIELRDVLCKDIVNFDVQDLVESSKLYYRFMLPFTRCGEYEYTVTDISFKNIANGLLRIVGDEALKIVEHPIEFKTYDNTNEGYITPKII